MTKNVGLLPYGRYVIITRKHKRSRPKKKKKNLFAKPIQISHLIHGVFFLPLHLFYPNKPFLTSFWFLLFPLFYFSFQFKQCNACMLVWAACANTHFGFFLEIRRLSTSASPAPYTWSSFATKKMSDRVLNLKTHQPCCYYFTTHGVEPHYLFVNLSLNFHNSFYILV